MKKFRFPLLTLLRHRVHLEEQAQLKLSKAERDLQEAEHILDAYHKDLVELNETKGQLLHHKVGGETIMQAQRYSIVVRNKIVDAEELIEKRKQIIELRKQDLMKRTQEKKSLEILKEKQYQEWKKANKVKEIREADDFAQIRFVHQENPL